MFQFYFIFWLWDQRLLDDAFIIELSRIWYAVGARKCKRIYTYLFSFAVYFVLIMLIISYGYVQVLIKYKMTEKSFIVIFSAPPDRYFRYKRPNMLRTLIISMIFFMLSAMFVLCFAAPYEVSMGIVITVAYILVYCFGLKWKNKSKFDRDAIAARRFSFEDSRYRLKKRKWIEEFQLVKLRFSHSFF